MGAREDICLREFNRVRALFGKPPLDFRKVPCLACGKTFLSKNYPHIRMCNRCKKNIPSDYGIFDTPQAGGTSEMSAGLSPSQIEPIPMFKAND